MASEKACSTPIFWGQGNQDPLVTMKMVMDSVDYLKEKLGVPTGKPGELGGLSYHLYEGMGHTTVPKELEDLKAFIKKAIPADT